MTERRYLEEYPELLIAIIGAALSGAIVGCILGICIVWLARAGS